ncbi:MAG: AMP-binding protein [Pseudomonadota bacterium]
MNEQIVGGSPGKLLQDVSAGLLDMEIDPARPLVAQGLDSLSAADLLEALQDHGYSVPYESLLDDISVNALAKQLLPIASGSAELTRRTDPAAQFPLTGPQQLWTELERAGWGTWGNISLCISLPAQVCSANRLPAITQDLCDQNEAMRLILETDDAGEIVQRALPNFEIPVELRPAPDTEKQAMRLFEAFEGEEYTPFAPSTRALVLAAKTSEGRHFMCITMHHVFSDRISMHNLRSQIEALVSAQLEAQSSATDFGDFATWQSANVSTSEAPKNLAHLLSNTDLKATRPKPSLVDAEDLELGDLPMTANLRPAESQALEAIALQLETTLPILLHALFGLLMSRLTDDKKVLAEEEDALLCHVVSNREQNPALRKMVGCFDTSIPVALRLDKNESLQDLCRRTRKALSEASQFAADAPRGAWLQPDVPGALSWTDLFERIAHINIVRAAPRDDSESADLDIREHSVRRVQTTRWGMLMRAKLPASDQQNEIAGDAVSQENASIRFSAFSEDRDLASVALFCLTKTLRALIGHPIEQLGDLNPMEMVELVVARAKFASAQVKRGAARVTTPFSGTPFVYEKLIARQQRWYLHNDKFELVRDEHNRFVGTAANPFPFTQLDKLLERDFLEKHGLPLPKILHVLPKTGLENNLAKVAPDLPASFAIKPVGAGHSFGVTVVRDGRDMTRNGAQFDVAKTSGELADMAERGYCVHEGNVFPFNFSSFLIEDLVIDENGFTTPTDYKIFMIGDRLLWIQLHFKADGHTWVAFLDENFKLTEQPAWDPTTCWRTHGALVCTQQDMADARRPSCLQAILDHSKRLGAEMGIFVRLDWYADQTHGPLMGEITTFPHMLQPRSFYTEWANGLLWEHWLDPDGCGYPEYRSQAPAQATYEMVDSQLKQGLGLLDILPDAAMTLWSLEDGISFEMLRRYIKDFDLSGYDVQFEDRVAISVENGTSAAALLLATINRYVAVPLGPDVPEAMLEMHVEALGVQSIVVLADTPEADRARELAETKADLKVIELTRDQNGFAQPQLDGLKVQKTHAKPEDPVLLLRTSGSTGQPKTVSYSLGRLLRAGAMIAQSLELNSKDRGLSMLPLHHVGGISCNLIAPALSATPIQFHKAFDPKRFFEDIQGNQGITWCYLVPAMWEMLLEYAAVHPELKKDRNWPHLRALRNAGAELPHQLACKLSAFFGPEVTILPTYGMTEAMPIAAPPVGYRLERENSVGGVMPNVAVEIIDPDNSDHLVLDAGIVGEITVKGATVLEGYEGDLVDRTDAFTPRGFFRTGDLGYLAEDGSGWLFVTGRIKDAINRGGETIAPAEIEALINSYPEIAEATKRPQIMAFARAHAELGEDVALAVAPIDAKIDLGALTEWAANKLPSSMAPKTLILMPDLPVSSTGKKQRAVFSKSMQTTLPVAQLGQFQSFKLLNENGTPELLSEFTLADRAIGTAQGQKAISLEAVAEVIGEFVGLDGTLNPNTKLDDLGVNSLAAVELATVLNAHFGSALPAWVAADNPTPQALYDQLLQDLGADALVPSAPVQTADYRPAPSVASEPLRMLFLHGEAADADLMTLSLQATRWTDKLAQMVTFEFLDAPHLSPPKPEFHPAAVAAGFYSKPEYRSWGCTQIDMFHQSIAVINEALDHQGPFDAIGGMCDGGLLAAYVAAQRPELKFYLNIASNPISRLPKAVRAQDWIVKSASLHLISRFDEMSSFEELLEIPARCQTASIVQHDLGHAVPPLADRIGDEVLATMSRFGAAKHNDIADAPGKTVLVPSNKPVSSKLEKAVRKTMADVLGQDAIGERDDFFDLGGTSLLAMALTKRLEKQFGASVPIEQLYRDGATAQSLAQVVADHSDIDDDLRLVSINQSNADTAFYGLPPMNGHLSDYLAVGKILAPHAQIKGLSFRRLLSNRWERPMSLHEIAKDAADMILADIGSKPINVMGNSLAGAYAFETAKEIRKRGHAVHSLVLIDSDPQFDPAAYPPFLSYLAGAALDFSREIRGKKHKVRNKTYLRLRLRAELAKLSREPISVDQATLFVAREGRLTKEEIQKWRDAVSGALNIIEIDGPHGGLRQPEIAQQIVDGLIPLIR